LVNAQLITEGSVVGLEHCYVVKKEDTWEKKIDTIEYKVITQEKSRIVGGAPYLSKHLALEKIVAGQATSVEDPKWLLNRHSFTWSFYTPS
jgi:uncharacterized membrane protein